ncbi:MULTISPECIES: hypothetical protein [Oceanimonas]|uniref:Uncharacterized protein n=1 Tax=Oceanimonas smirnovii TaxID=264574 RepID=A0ABW7P014_9GAMM
MEIPTRIKQQTCMDCLSGHSLGFDIRMEELLGPEQITGWSWVA